MAKQRLPRGHRVLPVGITLALIWLGAFWILGVGALTQSAAAATFSVSISGFAFRGPTGSNTVTVNVGDAVTWTNFDFVPHTATSNGGLWDSGTLNNSQSFSHAFSSPGTYTYFCAIHPSMTGTVVVQAAVPTATTTATATPTMAMTTAPTATATSSSTATPTMTPMATATPSATQTETPSATPTATATSTPVATSTDTPSPTLSVTATATGTPSAPAEVTMEIQLNAGWNLVALPLAPGGPKHAEDLLNEIRAQDGTAGAQAARWVNGAWESHLRGFDPNNFPVELGKGYFIRVSRPATWTVRGGP